MHRVFALIPCHNNKREVLTILQCLSRQTWKDVHSVLVDDGSTDGTGESVARMFPHVKLLRGDGELWWTGANELGVNYILPLTSAGDFILLLNNDVKVSEDYVEKLVEASLVNGRALVGSTLVDLHDETFIEGAIRLDNRLNLFPNRDRKALEVTTFDTNVDVLPGRGTLVPIEVFQRVGNFNRKRLPHYGADYEFTTRAKRAGFPLVVSHVAKVFADLSITGIESPSSGYISLKKCLELLFSKKSKTNLVYYLTYVWLCSDGTFKVRNCLAAFRSILANTLLKVRFVYMLWWPIGCVIWTPSGAFVLFGA